MSALIIDFIYKTFIINTLFGEHRWVNFKDMFYYDIKNVQLNIIFDCYLFCLIFTAMAPVAQLASYLNIPVFGWISSDPPLADKTLYSTLVRFLWSINNIGTYTIWIKIRKSWSFSPNLSKSSIFSQINFKGYFLIIFLGGEVWVVDMWHRCVYVCNMGICCGYVIKVYGICMWWRYMV